MSQKKKAADAERMERIIAEARATRESREKTYREKALKLFPWVCARCTREFEGKKIRELTVHHKDHNHDNNPPDGSNWELLCVYCHDHEHEKMFLGQHLTGEATETAAPVATFQPFAGLDDLFKKK